MKINWFLLIITPLVGYTIGYMCGKFWPGNWPDWSGYWAATILVCIWIGFTWWWA